MKNILAIGAHPDDIEIGCAGTLMKLKKQGKFIICLIMSEGENWENKTKNERMNEQQEAAQLLKIDKLLNANYSDGYVFNSSKTIDLITDVIVKYNIDTIITHYYNDTHQDHVETYRAARAASQKCDNFITYESLSSKDFKANMFVTINKFEKNKVKIINCFKSQVYKYEKRNQSLTDYINCKDRLYGMKINTLYAEGLRIEKVKF